nr:hypothetical protein [Tanacetum cinerariifolium]
MMIIRLTQSSLNRDFLSSVAAVNSSIDVVRKTDKNSLNGLIIEVIANSRESLKPELFVVYPGSVAARIKDRKCKTRGGSHEHKDATSCHLKISAITPPAWKNHMDVELLDLYDRCYARHAVVNNIINRRERAREEECEGLWVKCERLLKCPSPRKLRSLNMIEKRWYQNSSYDTIELVYSDDMGSLVGMLVSSAILYGRCRAYEQVTDMKEPFDRSKLKGYRSSYKKDHTLANNDFATATFPWHVPLRTQIPLPTSQRATPSSALVSNPMSPPADDSVTKPQSSPL